MTKEASGRRADAARHVDNGMVICGSPGWATDPPLSHPGRDATLAHASSDPSRTALTLAALGDVSQSPGIFILYFLPSMVAVPRKRGTAPPLLFLSDAWPLDRGQAGIPRQRSSSSQRPVPDTGRSCLTRIRDAVTTGPMAGIDGGLTGRSAGGSPPGPVGSSIAPVDRPARHGPS
jgi:hypothetical protein